MIRLVVANQRGGVGKTTAAVNYAWYLASRGHRTLLIDTDSQGSIGVMLNLKPKHYFSHFLVNKFHLDECTIQAGENFHVLCGNKETVQAESALAGAVVRELTLKVLLEPYEKQYDAVVIDYARDGTQKTQLTAREIERMKIKPDGGRRVVLAYLSVGEAEQYRSYWNKRWNWWWGWYRVFFGPKWLGHENPEWHGNVSVRYWNADWQSLICGPGDSYLGRIVAGELKVEPLDRQRLG